MSIIHNPVLKQRDQFTLFKNHTNINKQGKIVGRLVFVTDEVAINIFDISIDKGIIAHDY
jgi:hypothetical protein